MVVFRVFWGVKMRGIPRLSRKIYFLEGAETSRDIYVPEGPGPRKSAIPADSRPPGKSRFSPIFHLSDNNALS